MASAWYASANDLDLTGLVGDGLVGSLLLQATATINGDDTNISDLSGEVTGGTYARVDLDGVALEKPGGGRSLLTTTTTPSYGRGYQQAGYRITYRVSDGALLTWDDGVVDDGVVDPVVYGFTADTIGIRGPEQALGPVNTVNGLSPDSDGNVEVGAADLAVTAGTVLTGTDVAAQLGQADAAFALAAAPQARVGVEIVGGVATIPDTPAAVYIIAPFDTGDLSGLTIALPLASKGWARKISIINLEGGAVGEPSWTFADTTAATEPSFVNTVDWTAPAVVLDLFPLLSDLIGAGAPPWGGYGLPNT